MSLLPADPTRRNALLAVLLALSSIYFARTYVYSPAVAAAAAKRDRLSDLTEWNERAAQEVISKEALGPRLAKYRAHAARLEPLVPAEGELDGLMDIARTAGAEIASVRPGFAETGEFFEIQSYEVQAAGSYHAIARFATAVATLGRTVVPVVVDIVPAVEPSGTPDGRPRADNGQVVAALELRLPVAGAGVDAPDGSDSAPPATQRQVSVVPPLLADAEPLPWERDHFEYEAGDMRNPFLPPRREAPQGPRFHELVLLGVVLASDAERGVALLRAGRTRGSPTFRVQPGEELGEVRVLAVRRDRVIVAVEGQAGEAEIVLPRRAGGGGS